MTRGGSARIPAVRRVLGAAGFVVLLVTALVVGLSGQVAAREPVAQVRLSPSPTPPAAGGSDSPDPTVAPDGDLPSTGPGIDEPGVTMVVQPRTGGALDVVESVLVSDATDRFTVRPPDTADGGPTFSTAYLYAADLRLTVDGRRRSLDNARVTASRTIELSQPGTRFELRYQLRGAVVRSKPSVGGRALALVRPLVTDLDGQLPTMVLLPSAAALSLYCPVLGGAQETDCGEPADPGVRFADPLRLSDATAVVQLDLDRAR